jgi:hypothetical protein
MRANPRLFDKRHAVPSTPVRNRSIQIIGLCFWHRGCDHLRPQTRKLLGWLDAEVSWTVASALKNQASAATFTTAKRRRKWDGAPAQCQRRA